MKPKLIQPSRMGLEEYYQEACKGCSLTAIDLAEKRKAYVMDKEVMVNTDYHKECASCFAKFLHPLYEKGKDFYII